MYSVCTMYSRHDFYEHARKLLIAVGTSTRSMPVNDRTISISYMQSNIDYND